MNNERKKKNDRPSSHFMEPQPEGKVDEGNKAVKKPEDETYHKQPDAAKTANPAARKEGSEQPVHSVKAN